MKAARRGLGAFATIATAWGLYAATPREDDLRDFVVTEKVAYAVLPPEAIAASGIRHIEWTPAGNYLLMVQETPKLLPGQVVDRLLGKDIGASELSLLVWSKASRKTQNCGPIRRFYSVDEWQYAQYSLGQGRLSLPLRWLPGSDCAFLGDGEVTVTSGQAAGRPAEGLKIFDAATGTITDLRFAGAPNRLETTYSFDVFPNRPQFLVVQTSLVREAHETRPPTSSDYKSYVFIVDLKGRASPPVEAGPGFLHIQQWLEEGSVVQLRQIQTDANRRRTQTSRFFSVSELAFVERANPRPMAPAAPLPLEIRSTSGETRAGVVSVPTRPLWLSATGPSEEPAVLLSATADQAELAPSLDMVAVREKGVATIRPLAAINRAAYDEIARTQALQIAKMTGLGLLMYGADYDDLLPSSQMFDEGMVDPYLKDLSYRGRFSFTYRGGALNGLNNPAGTPLGFVRGPGGYAVVFADGHAEWRTGSPPPGESIPDLTAEFFRMISFSQGD